jgi:hypothetical protein
LVACGGCSEVLDGGPGELLVQGGSLGELVVWGRGLRMLLVWGGRHDELFVPDGGLGEL